jgi:hypothetical protein
LTGVGVFDIDRTRRDPAFLTMAFFRKGNDMVLIGSRRGLFTLASIGILLVAGVYLQLRGFHSSEKNGGLQGREERVSTPGSFQGGAERSFPSFSSPSSLMIRGKASSAFNREGNNTGSYRQEIGETLASVIRQKFPEARFSEADVERLAESIQTIRDSLEGLRELERTRENAGTLKHLRSEFDRASRIFQETMGMSLTEFTRSVQGEGIDGETGDDEEEGFEYLRDQP